MRAAPLRAPLRAAATRGARAAQRRAALLDAHRVSARASFATSSGAVGSREQELEQQLLKVRWQMQTMASQLDRLERTVADNAAAAHPHPERGASVELELTSQELLKKRNRKYFTESLRRVVEVLSLEEGAVPVGSFKYLAFLYPSDIDLFEGLFFPFTDRSTAAWRAAGRIQTMARRIELEEARGKMFFADFKAGYDERLFLLSNEEERFDFSAEDFDADGFLERLDSAVSGGLLSRQQAEPAKALAMRISASLAARRVDTSVGSESGGQADPVPYSSRNRTAAAADSRQAPGRPQKHVLPSAADDPRRSSTIRAHDWIELKEAVRKLYTLRWSLSELVAGRKTMREGSSGSSVVTHLGEALQSGSVVKIDVWGLLQDELGYTKYAEVLRI